MKRKILCISSIIITSLLFVSLAFSDPTNVPNNTGVSTFANISGGNCIAVLTPPYNGRSGEDSYVMTEFNNNWSGSLTDYGHIQLTPSGNYIALQYWNPNFGARFTKPIQIAGQNSYQTTLCGYEGNTLCGYEGNNLTFDISPTQITLLGTNIFSLENGMTPVEAYVVPGIVAVTLYSNGNLLENYNTQFSTLAQNVASFQLVGNDILNVSYNDGSSKLVYCGNFTELNDLSNSKPLNLSVNEISVSPNSTNNAIYNMTIPSFTIDGDLMNSIGLNGFFYNVTIKNNSATTTMKEYPLVGGILNTSGNSLTIKPISFEMEAPKYSGSGTPPTVNVQLEAQPQASLSPITITSGTATLPQFVQPTFDSSKYTISIDSVSSMMINNQISILNNYTCGTPFLVQIQDHSGNIIPSTSPLYNDIVFYTNRNNST
ncbi:MAG: hypothetical protein NTX05_08325, partial [Fusobacteria bacterium]|nr:hypothetical protein [Fusobacteriota bacterium]